MAKRRVPGKVGIKTRRRATDQPLSTKKIRVSQRPIDEVLGRLKNVQPCGDGYSALCPAHADGSSSLAIGEDDDGKALLYCHAGCEFPEILAALKLRPGDLFPGGPGGTARGSDDACRLPTPPAVRRKRAEQNGNIRPRPAQTAKAVVKPIKRSTKRRARVLKNAKGSKNDWVPLVRTYRAECTPNLLQQLAEQLSVSADALRALHLGWNPEDECYTFPEFTASGNICGIVRRFDDGSKKAMADSKRGLYLPVGWADREGPIIIVEGASDTAAGWDLGLAVIGRPNAKGGGKTLARLLADQPEEREIIVMGENDATSAGNWPGRDGAEKVATELASSLERPVSWALPPGGSKDLRTWLIRERKRSDA